MPFFTLQHIARLHDSFSETEVTFNTQVIIASGLLTSEVRLTAGEERFPCVLYACSIKSARVIAEINMPQPTAPKTDTRTSSRMASGSPHLS